MGKKKSNFFRPTPAPPSLITPNLSQKTTWDKSQNTLEAQAPCLPENGLAVEDQLPLSVLYSFIVMAITLGE